MKGSAGPEGGGQLPLEATLSPSIIKPVANDIVFRWKSLRENSESLKIWAKYFDDVLERDGAELRDLVETWAHRETYEPLAPLPPIAANARRNQQRAMMKNLVMDTGRNEVMVFFLKDVLRNLKVAYPQFIPSISRNLTDTETEAIHVMIKLWPSMAAEVEVAPSAYFDIEKIEDYDLTDPPATSVRNLIIDRAEEALGRNPPLSENQIRWLKLLQIVLREVEARSH